MFALEDEDSEDSTSSEQFGSFLEVDGQMFKMEIDSGTVTRSAIEFKVNLFNCILYLCIYTCISCVCCTY